MTQSARVHQILCTKCGYQVNRIRGHALAEDLGPGMRLDLRELELCVVGVHGIDLLPSGGTQDLDDLHQLIYPALTYKSRPPMSVTRLGVHISIPLGMVLLRSRNSTMHMLMAVPFLQMKTGAPLQLLFAHGLTACMQLPNTDHSQMCSSSLLSHK